MSDETLVQKVEEQMVDQAEAMIDRMIPRDGLSTFASPEARALFGLGADLDDGTDMFGQIDLDATGSAAFAGDLDETGSGAFAGDLDRAGSAAFGALNIAKSIGKLTKRVQATAKAGLKKVGRAHKQVTAQAAKALKAGMPGEARKLVNQAQQLTEKGKKLAEQAVNPKITREMAKASILPWVKNFAKKVAVGAKEAKIMPGQTAQQAVTAAVARKIAGNPESSVAGFLGLSDMTPSDDIVDTWEPDQMFGDSDF